MIICTKFIVLFCAGIGITVPLRAVIWAKIGQKGVYLQTDMQCEERLSLLSGKGMEPFDSSLIEQHKLRLLYHKLTVNEKALSLCFERH